MQNTAVYKSLSLPRSPLHPFAIPTAILITTYHYVAVAYHEELGAG